MNLELRLKPGRKRKVKDDDVCMVCGGKSVGINFGVHTCSPCKAFFRRNAVKLGTYEFQCRGNGDCPVTSDTRRQCNCCRLAKCFRVGMNRKAIRTENQRLERNQLIEANRRKRAEQINNNEKSLIPIHTNKSTLIRSNHLSLHSQAYTTYLSSKDYNILTNIFQAYERTCLSYTYREHLSLPVNENLTLDKFLNASANMYTALIHFFKSIPEFNHISINGKLSLVKNNLNHIFRIHSTYMMQVITPELVTDAPIFLHIFPKDLYYLIRNASIGFSPFIYDPILIKLFMIILMLSTYLNTNYKRNRIDFNDDDENNSIRIIFNIQNNYVDLLWRYILSRSSDYRQSVNFLILFISRILCSQIVQVQINQFIQTNLSSQCQSLEPIIRSIWMTNNKEHTC